jgi:hypothetical protein
MAYQLETIPVIKAFHLKVYFSLTYKHVCVDTMYKIYIVQCYIVKSWKVLRARLDKKIIMSHCEFKCLNSHTLLTK